MLDVRFLKKRKGQTILEYGILIGVITVALFSMGTYMKRSIQSVVKVTADQIGNQQESEQNFNREGGYLAQMDSSGQTSTSKQVVERPNYFINMIYGDRTASTTNSLTNLGFTEGE